MKRCLALVAGHTLVFACAMGSQLTAELIEIEVVPAIDLGAKTYISTAM